MICRRWKSYYWQNSCWVEWLVAYRLLLELAYCKCRLEIICNLTRLILGIRGPGSSVGIATELRAGRSRIESRWRREFPPVQTSPGAHPASCTMGIGTEVKCGRGELLTTHPLLVPRLWKSTAIRDTSTHPPSHTGLVTGSLYLFNTRNPRTLYMNIVDFNFIFFYITKDISVLFF